MTKFNLIKQSAGHYFIEGDLTFSSLNKKNTQSFDFLKKTDQTCINLSSVTAVDSAGLALLLEWLKHSKKYDTKLVFNNLPHQLLTLATLSGLDLDEYLTDISQDN